MGFVSIGFAGSSLVGGGNGAAASGLTMGAFVTGGGILSFSIGFAGGVSTFLVGSGLSLVGTSTKSMGK